MKEKSLWEKLYDSRYKEYEAKLDEIREIYNKVDPTKKGMILSTLDALLEDRFKPIVELETRGKRYQSKKDIGERVFEEASEEDIDFFDKEKYLKSVGKTAETRWKKRIGKESGKEVKEAKFEPPKGMYQKSALKYIKKITNTHLVALVYENMAKLDENKVKKVLEGRPYSVISNDIQVNYYTLHGNINAMFEGKGKRTDISAKIVEWLLKNGYKP